MSMYYVRVRLGLKEQKPFRSPGTRNNLILSRFCSVC